jgi:mgtE-like transporter
VVAGTAALGILLVVAYSAASASYRFGLDPDNVGIPVVTSTMDLVGILCVVAGVAILL